MAGGPDDRLMSVRLDEGSIDRGTPDVEHERAVAIYDLLEENVFRPVGDGEGPFTLLLGIQENRLVFQIGAEDGAPLIAHMLSLNPLRKVVKDYFLICESYFSAIRSAAPAQIEAIPETLVFNCTGYGAKAMFGDEGMIAKRGQLAVMIPQPEVRHAYSIGSAYMFPRPDGILLGGTFEDGETDPQPTPEGIAAILRRNAALQPDRCVP